jgi:formylglycine-generating enzyme required for sulfatase activity
MNQDAFLIDSSLADVQGLTAESLLALQQSAAEQAGIPISFSDDMPAAGAKAPEMALIPPGLYEMGSHVREFGSSAEEWPLHTVSISYAFAMSRYTVTAEEFVMYQQASGFRFRRDLITTQGRRPVINIRREEAQDYANWLSEQTGHRYRLPTEAEWEYACRAGSCTPFSFGESVSCKEVNFNPAFPYEEARQKRKWYLPRCMPVTLPMDVGLHRANLWGLYDMHGNVWEFTLSPWSDGHTGQPRDGSSDNRRKVKRFVVKGGSYFDAAVKARSAARMPRVWDELDVNLGIRLLREIVED